MSQKFVDVPERALDVIIGMSSRLLIVVNADHGNTETAFVYEFTRNQLRNDADLRAILYGRVNSKGVFKACKTVVKALRRGYADNMTYMLSIADIENIANIYNLNLGQAVEHLLGEKTSRNRDVKLKQDILLDKHYCQVKCSLATTRTKGSYATTNDHI